MHIESVTSMYLVLKKVFLLWMCHAVYICSYFCELNTMYHCIIVTFIKQTINILTFLTETLCCAWCVAGAAFCSRTRAGNHKSCKYSSRVQAGALSNIVQLSRGRSASRSGLWTCRKLRLLLKLSNYPASSVLDTATGGSLNTCPCRSSHTTGRACPAVRGRWISPLIHSALCWVSQGTLTMSVFLASFFLLFIL